MTPCHLPAEIIFSVGEYLDGPSLYACLQVCHQWNHTLHPLAWVSINKRQWYYPSFPIQKETRLLAPFDTKESEANAAKILSCLEHTRSLDWSDTQPVPLHGWRCNTLPLAHISIPSLEIFRSMTHLVRLSLTVTCDKPSFDVLPSILSLSNLLLNLHALSLDIPILPPGLEPERFYPLFSRLEELDIRGELCFRPLSRPSFSQGDTTVLLPSNQVRHPQQQELQPWRVKRLTVQCLNTYFLGKCLSLEHLVVIDPFMARDWTRTGPIPRQLVFTQLQRMPNLRIIWIGRWMKWGVRDEFTKVLQDGRDYLEADVGGGGSCGGDGHWKRVVVKTRTTWTAAKTVVRKTMVRDPKDAYWSLEHIASCLNRR